MKIHFVVLLLFLVSCTGKEESSDNAIIESEPKIEEPVGFYIGTYTKGDSEGIYYAVFDPSDGSFNSLQLAASASDPSYLTLSSDGSYLYAVDEAEASKLVAFSIDTPGQLTPLDTVSSQGSYSCYITTNETGQFVMAANYGSGNIISVGISVDGGFLDSASSKQHTGTGPYASRQEGPHAHSIVLDPNQRFALSADLGADKIFIYEVGQNGELVENAPAFVETSPGAGPRHIAFHPDGKIVYVINELNSTITVYQYNPDAGILSELQTVTTLPDGFEGTNYCADIHVHPNGKYLYGSNRGHGSIASFRIDDEGKLEPTGHFGEEINWPRNFSVTPDGGYLLVANERGNSIISVKINMENGQLEATGNKIEVPSPVCIVFSE